MVPGAHKAKNNFTLIKIPIHCLLFSDCQSPIFTKINSKEYNSIFNETIKKGNKEVVKNKIL